MTNAASETRTPVFFGYLLAGTVAILGFPSACCLGFGIAIWLTQAGASDNAIVNPNVPLMTIGGAVATVILSLLGFKAKSIIEGKN